MQCKSLWIKVSAKCINVNVMYMFTRRVSHNHSLPKKLAVHRVLYPSMLTESWVEGKSVEEKDAQPTERTAALCRTSPGLTTLRHWPRKHSSISTSSANSEEPEPEPRPPIMCTFYRGTIESILTSCITVWYGACNTSCRKSLQRIVRAAEKIVGVSLPSLQDIYSTRLTRKALSIAGDPTHPTNSFFNLLPSGRRLRSLQARTNRLKDSFIHQAVRKLNSLPSLPPPPFYPTQHWNLSLRPPPPPPQLPTSPGPSTPPYKLWPAPVTLCSTGLISTSSSIVCKLPLLTVW